MTTVEKVSPEIDFTHKVGNHSSPLYVKVNPINNVQTFTASSTSVYGPVEILVPAKVLSLKKSKLSWDLALASVTGTIAPWIQGNSLCQLDRIVITTQNTNNILLDVPNLNRYASMFSPICTTLSELRNKASPGYDTTVANNVVASTSVAAGQAIPYEDISRNFQSTNIDGNAVDYGCPGDGIRKLILGNNAAGTTNLSFEFDLGSLQGTICDLDQLLYFSGEQLLISIYFSPVNRYAWKSTSSASPVTGAATITTAVTVTNINMYLYTEQNLSVSTGIVEKIMKGGGISIPFPYPFVQRQAVTSGSISVTQQLTRGFGSKLLLVGASFFNPTETNNLAQDHSISGLASATAGAGQYTLFAYNSLLDNIPILTNSNIVAINTAATQQNGEYFTYNKAHLKDSAIISINAYNNDFVHLDNFCSDPVAHIDWSCVDGLDLDAMHQYSFVVYGTATNSVTNNLYLAFICQKTLNLLPTGVQVS